MITRERARELRAAIESAVSAYGLDDAAAVAVVELFPQWEVGKTYAIGTRVQHDGKLYECVNAHTAAVAAAKPAARRGGQPVQSMVARPGKSASPGFWR